VTEKAIAIHNRAMQIAKQRAGIVTDAQVRSLTPRQFSELCAAAESIRRNELERTQEENSGKEHQPCDVAREYRERSRA
jgi:hypothetical protein